MNIKGMVSVPLTGLNGLVNNTSQDIRAQESDIMQQTSWNDPQEIVSISQEGRQMWEESQTDNGSQDYIQQTEKSIADIMGNTTETKRTEETDKDYTEALEALQKLREEEAKQYEEQAEEAKKLAMQNSKHLNDMEKDNRDLVIMLESFKGMEERKQGGDAAKTKQKEAPSGEQEELQNISGQIRSEAAAKEANMDEVLEKIHTKAQEGFHKAGEISKDLRKQLDELKLVIQDPANSDEDRADAIAQFRERSSVQMQDMEDYQKEALQRMKIYKEVKLLRLGTQNMIKANQAQKEIDAAASAAAVKDAFATAYETAERDKIDDLEERIKELQGIKETGITEEEGEENTLDPETIKVDTADDSEADN